MSDMQQKIAGALEYMQNNVREGRYGNLEYPADQAAFEEDLNEYVLDKLEEQDEN